ncbi:MAG: hypothetical protein RLZZ272_477 [Actinomycetota bacterium]
MSDPNFPPTPARSATSPVALVVASALLALALGGGMWSVAQGISVRGADDGVTVTGSARASVRADRALWTINVNEQSFDLPTAIARTNEGMDLVTGYLTANGIADEQVSFGGLTTNVNYEYLDGNFTGNVLGYSAYRELKVRTDDVDLVDRLSRGIGSVLESGYAISAWAPEYYITILPELRPQLLEEAVADALARAEAMVSVTGGEVSGVRAVRSGPFQVSSPDSVEVSDYGLYDTTTIDKTVTATVTVTFATR